MKKTIKSLLAIAMTAFAFTACSDIPAPYTEPGSGSGSGGGGGEEGTTAYVEESFSTSFGTFTNTTVKGSPWVIDFKTAKGTGYDSGSKTTTESEAYLCSKALDLSASTGAYLQFEYILRYASQGTNKVYATSAFTGDPTTTKWTDITGKLTEGSDWNTFASYKQNLPEEFIGKSAVVIAFYYACSASNSATIEIKNVKVQEGKADESDTPTDTNDYGTAEKPITVAQALAIMDSYKTNQSSPVDAYVKGVITKFDEGGDAPGNNYGNATYWISDDASASNSLEVYRGYGLNGAKIGANDLKIGDEVIVVGKLVLFKNTKEFTQGSKIYSLNGKTAGGDEPTPDPQPITGENLLTNGDFESWTGGLPDGWKSTTTAGNATLSQSPAAHSGSYAVLVKHDGGNNKRLAYKEITLKAGDYTMAFYVKAADAAGASVNPGYVNVVDGKVNGSYQYGGYVNNITTEWQQVVNNFSLSADATINLVVMVPKNSGTDVIIDDFTLTTSNGGIIDDGSETGGETGGETNGETGSATAPLTVAQIHAAVAAMPAGQESKEDYYAKGKICSIKYTFSAQFGTATFDISDDGSTSGTKFTCYSTLYFGNKSWVEGNKQIKVGDEVVICGKVINYQGNVPEFSSKKHHLISINGATE